MRRRRAMAVRIVAGLALAATLVALTNPSGSLRAQAPRVPDPPKGGGDLRLPPPREAPADPSVAIPAPNEPPFLPAETSLKTEQPAPPTPEVILPSPSAPPQAVPEPSPPSTHIYTPSGTLADPEVAAKTFLDKSSREVDEAIKALNQEAETLRARLQKVEAGLSRWESVKAALEADGRRPSPSGREGSAARRPSRPRTGTDDGSPMLTPAPNDRRSPFDVDATPGPVIRSPDDPDAPTPKTSTRIGTPPRGEVDDDPTPVRPPEAPRPR